MKTTMNESPGKKWRFTEHAERIAELVIDIMKLSILTNLRLKWKFQDTPLSFFLSFRFLSENIPFWFSSFETKGPLCDQCLLNSEINKTICYSKFISWGLRPRPRTIYRRSFHLGRGVIQQNHSFYFLPDFKTIC